MALQRHPMVLDYTLQAGLGLGVDYTLGNYPATATDGLRNITGVVNGDGTVTLYGVTSIAPRRARIIVAWGLLVEPDVLETRAVINAVDHCCQAFDVWFVANRCARIKQDRAGVV